MEINLKSHMATPVHLIDNLKKGFKDNEMDEEKMDLLMRTIKAVHSTADAEVLNVEELNKKRNATEQFSKLIAPKLQVKIDDFMVADISCELVTPGFPHRNDKVILYCHGGGYVSGGLGYARILARKLANNTGLKVYSFEYRLAPENMYPAALDDGMSVWNYLMLKGYGAKDIIIAGDSAGGNMALEMCLSLRKEERQLPGGLILFSPWTDMRACTSSYQTYKDKDPLLTYEYIVAVRDAYIGSDADPADEKYSPVMADFSGFPPTYIQVGSNEILRKDSEHLLKALKDKGVFAQIDVCKGGWHVYQQMPIHKATLAMEMVNEFIDNYLFK